MPALSPIKTYVDDPVASAMSFEPVQMTGSLASFTGERALIVEDGGGAQHEEPVVLPAVLAPTMTISLQRPSKTSRISKARVKIIIPKPILDNGVATTAKSHESSIDIVLMSSEKALPVDRDELWLLLEAIMTNSAVRAVLIDAKPFY